MGLLFKTENRGYELTLHNDTMNITPIDSILGYYEFSSSGTPIYAKDSIFIIFGEDIYQYVIEKKEWKQIHFSLINTADLLIKDVDNRRSAI